MEAKEVNGSTVRHKSRTPDFTYTNESSDLHFQINGIIDTEFKHRCYENKF
jgi:hypothetical protein